MALFPAMRDLLGDGDPLVAFERLQHRLIGALELGDDERALEAAAYSLGISSSGGTHLARLVDFGQERGYEARQARRHSDRGLRQLARLITSNWIVDTVPTLRVLIVQDSEDSFSVTFSASQLQLVGMHDPEAFTVAVNGTETSCNIVLDTEVVSDTADGGNVGRRASRVVHTLRTPIPLAVPLPGTPRYLRFKWQGEVWPRMAATFAGGVPDHVQLATESLGANLQISVYSSVESGQD